MSGDIERRGTGLAFVHSQGSDDDSGLGRFIEGVRSGWLDINKKAVVAVVLIATILVVAAITVNNKYGMTVDWVTMIALVAVALFGCALAILFIVVLVDAARSKITGKSKHREVFDITSDHSDKD